jgi:WD40 repeat protein
MLYKAFVSYSHAADGKLAPALQRALHHIAKPWYRLRTMRLFRDQTNLATSPGLWTEIEQALGQSEFFIHLASPTAAQSPWVQKEVDWWLTNRSRQTFLIVLTDGVLHWDNVAQDLDWSVTTALPRRVAKAFAEEPLHTDLRWAHSFDQLSLRHSQFRAAILELAATLLGRPKDELDGDDVRQYRRTRRVAWSAAGVLGVLFVAATFAAWLATQQSLLATSRSLAARSEALLPTNPELALLLAREALRFSADDQADYALRRAFLRNPERMIHQGSPVPNLVAKFVGSDLVIAAEPGKRLVGWSARTGERLGELPVEAGDRLDTIGVAAGHSLIVAPTNEVSFTLYDAKTLKALAKLPGSSPRLSRDGKILTAGHGKAIRQWLVPSLQERKVAAALPAGFEVQDVSADGSLLLLAKEGEVSAIVVADAVSGRVLARLPQGIRREGMGFTPEGRYLINEGMAGERFQLWEAETGKPRLLEKPAFGELGWTTTVAVSPDGTLLVSGNRSGGLQTWDLKTGEWRGLLDRVHRNDIRSIEFSPDGQTMLSVGVDGNACLWDTASMRCLVELGGKGDDAWDVGFAADSRHFLTTHLDGTVRIWDRERWHPRQTFAARTEAISEDGRFVLGTTKKNNVALWDAKTGKPSKTLDADSGDIPNMIVDREAKLVAIAPEKKPVELWSLQTGQRLVQIGGAAATALAFTRDGSELLTGGEDGRLRRWSTREGSPLGDWQAKGAVRHIAALADGQRAVVVTAGGLSVHDIKSGAVLLDATLSEDAANSRALAISEDGILLFLAADQFPQIWDLRSLTRVRTLAGHEDEVWNGAFSPDRRLVLSASGFFHARGTPPDNGNGAHLWDLRSGRLVLSWRSAQHVVKAVSFANGGTEIIAGGMDGTVRRYACDVCLPLPKLAALASTRLARQLTEDERQRYVAQSALLGWIADWLP